MIRLFLPSLLLGALALLVGSAPAQAQVCDESLAYITETTRTNYSLGYENYRNEDYCAALPYLRWIIENEPMFASQGDPDERNYRRLAETYEAIATSIEDAATKRTYLDSALVVREQMYEAMAANNLEIDPRIQLLHEARFYAQHAEAYPAEQERLYDLYVEAHEMAPDSTDDYYLNEIARMATERVASEEMDPMTARDLVDALLPYADDPTYLQGVRDSFRLEPIEQWAFLYEKYQEGDQTEEIIGPLFGLTIQLDTLITEAHPTVDRLALRRELLPLAAELNPTPQILSFLGAQAVNDGRVDEGMTYFERAIEMTDSNSEKADLYYRLASTLYSEGQRSEAYQTAGQALQFDSNHGPSLYIRALVVSGTIRRGSVQAQAGAWCVA
ncbi:MAG: hypothetical protein HKN04_04415, partial [Rhodothermaceae bacterium]|nr:hypothetical protein [Rhodothermaceae bacterium]